MSLKFKDGVRIRQLTPQAWLMIHVVEEVYDEWDYDCVVTGGEDGTHRLGSLHFIGNGVDFRTHGLKVAHKKEILAKIKERLEPLGDYDVILEHLGKPKEHIHGEYQPKVE